MADIGQAAVTETSASGPDASKTQLPMFYRKPEALHPSRHGTLSLVTKPDYGFAATAHAVPIMASEMPAAMRSYPIVFVGPQKAPVVITGLRQNENLFVEPDGSWTAPHYVPAYVRRYPFVLAEDKQPTERLTLCIDRESDRIVETVTASLTGGDGATVPLFDGTEPSQATRGALEFCNQFQMGFAATRTVIESIDALGLFVTRKSTVTLEGREVLNLTDFQVVDEAALNALGDDDFLKLRKSGALAMIYCPLASSNSWNSLAYQAKARKSK
ncbi:SapC family protein [Mesorhizobium alhagi CCNWXJ12-2]|uniref:SapC family protein n=2 Tax=Allomesorhizobium alhagi TaxID=475067 RepID=H0HIU1_9HYPH|nr:SapC family protein [Mesorhizobium alhagi CCNWXJ12-2]